MESSYCSASATSNPISTKCLLSSSPYLYLERADLASVPLSAGAFELAASGCGAGPAPPACAGAVMSLRTKHARTVRPRLRAPLSSGVRPRCRAPALRYIDAAARHTYVRAPLGHAPVAESALRSLLSIFLTMHTGPSRSLRSAVCTALLVMHDQ
ncbi:hypothetical protein A0H81_05229 [Grifola frondosa]|uniref:Uncharacterized protein n=1 Tax=Grifola frondosa TaxID=5627 RepID=A0A1C7MCW9_GRIFR|nr:hypothetical protein A0H81_05229 [Grifola frondosa]